MAIPIIDDWGKYFSNPHEGLGSSYERIILNQKLHLVCKQYSVTKILETPSFGFTGISGINSLDLARHGYQITLEDHDSTRLKLISKLWDELNLDLTVNLNTDYNSLDYPDEHFEMAWNFSALWFVKSVTLFLSELCRVSSKCIMICVPNQDGLGYRVQMKNINPAQRAMINPDNINPQRITRLMHKQGWHLKHKAYIDCPPWFDIGMTKEDFLASLLKQHTPAPVINPNPHPVTILDYYKGLDPLFVSRMLRLSFVERVAPESFKKYWAHHQYLLFAKD